MAQFLTHFPNWRCTKCTTSITEVVRKNKRSAGRMAFVQTGVSENHEVIVAWMCVKCSEMNIFQLTMEAFEAMAPKQKLLKAPLFNEADKQWLGKVHIAWEVEDG